MLKLIIRLVFGHEFYVWHCDHNGVYRVFPCCTMQDALEWVGCAFNSDMVKIVSRNGYLLAVRYPTE